MARLFLPLVLIAYSTLLSPVWAQNPAPPQMHQMVPVIEGSVQPQLIPDSTVYRAYFLAVSTGPNPSDEDRSRQRAQLSRIGLQEMDRDALVDILAGFKTNYDALQTRQYEAANAAMARNQMPNGEEFAGQLDVLVLQTRDILKQRLTPEGMTRFDAFMQSEKKNIGMQQASNYKAPSLKKFFQSFRQRQSPCHSSKGQDLLNMTDQIDTQNQADITAALSAIFAALAHPDESVKNCAAVALQSINQRHDWADLLKDYIPQINAMFDSSNERLQVVPTLIYLDWRPAPPQAVPALANFLRRADRGPAAQASAVFTLIELAPHDPEVVAAIQEFLSRPLDSNSRIAALNSFREDLGTEASLIAVVISSLDDPDPGVRFTAIQTLGRMGQKALSQGQPKLQQLADDPTQPDDVKAAATEALSAIRPSE